MEHAEQLAVRWWQWAAAIPEARNPVLDPTGKFAAEGQPDDVWFLAGNFGGKLRRTCKVPIGRPLFFPLFNMYTQVSLILGRRTPSAPRASGYAELDGVRLPSQVVVNREPFPMYTPPGSPFGDHTERWRARAWGIWAGIDQVAPGEHLLVIHGEEEPGGFAVDVTYDLWIG